MAEKPRKTAQEKAQEALDVANRKVDSATERRDKTKALLEAIETDLKAYMAERDYLAQHPALKSLEDAVAEAGEQPIESDENLPGF
jgi:hypothetical protein